MSITARTATSSRHRLVAGLAGVTTAALLGGLAILATATEPEVPLPAAGRGFPTPGPGSLLGVTSDRGLGPSPRGVGDVRPRARRAARFVTAPPMPSSAPSRLRIPAIGVAAAVEDLGLTDMGALEVPRGPAPAGWYVGSPTPGALGPAILAGHVSFNGTPGVFRRLAELEVGDRVSVLREDGRTADFRVTRTQLYPKDRFPTRAVYGDTTRAGLRLITCGDLDANTNVFKDNLVVFAHLTGVRRG